jgi:hypothetical protein
VLTLLAPALPHSLPSRLPAGVATAGSGGEHGQPERADEAGFGAGEQQQATQAAE